MARLTKFASVNLNESYGKPDQAGSTNAGANSSTSGKSRLPTQGGMVVLTKPGRGPSTGSKSGRLGIPSPVNLPSLKREHSGGDTLVNTATSPPVPGWTKGSQGEILVGAATEKTFSGNSNALNSGVRAGPSDSLTENLKSLSTSPALGKPDVYAPPALRAIQANGGSTARNLPPTTGDKAAVIRGEEFPTLQASVLRPPTPPQQSRQKESQQKQREKQQEMKEQQLKLQQLSHQQQEHAQKQSLDDPSQPGKGSLQLQPAQPFRPQVKQERSQKENLKRLGGSVDQAFVLGGGGESMLSKSPPLVRLSHASNWADDERERIQNDDERERGHNLKLQNSYSSVQVGQDSPRLDLRPAGPSSEKETSWTSVHRDNLPLRNDEYTRNLRDFRTIVDGDMKGSSSKEGSDSRGFLFGRESFTSRGNSATPKDLSFPEIGGKEGYSSQEEHEWSGTTLLGKAAGTIREAVQGREGVYNRGWGVREAYGRDARETYGRDAREFSKRDVREPYDIDPKEMHIRDNREIFSRDAREMYNRDIREVHMVDVNAARQVGYGNFSDDGGNLRRTGFGDTMLGPGRGNFYGGGAAANPGFGYDSRYSRRYGFHSTGGDHPYVREARPGSASAALRSRHAEPSAALFSADGMGFRRTRSPGFDPERGVYEAEFERVEDEQRKKYEEKLLNEDERLGYTNSKSLQKGDDWQGPAGRGEQADAGKKPEEERRLREDFKNQLLLEEERRKEAAKRKLLELEGRIARREAEERRKGEVESIEKREDKRIDDTVQGISMAARQEGLEEASLNLEFEEDVLGTCTERNTGVGWKELDLPSKLARPSSASSSSSWTFRGAGEELSQEQDAGLGAAEAKNNQELRFARSKSPISWRKEANANGNGPTSKLFSSPYIESGAGFHRATDAGNYKLF